MLARLTILTSLLLCFAFGKTYVCLPFFNEFEILKAQFWELYDHVDYFVIHEGCETFSGEPKPFYFEENKEQFAPFLDKVILVQTHERITVDRTMQRDYHQKNQLMRGLSKCEPGDFILLCDCDEIVRVPALEKAKAALKENQLLVFEQTLYRYYANMRSPEKWQGPVLTRFKNFKHLGVFHVLRARLAPKGRKWKDPKYSGFIRGFVKDGGWHFTSLGGKDLLKLKLQTCGHSDSYGIKHFVNHLERTLKDELTKLERVEIDESYPRYFRENLDYIQEIGFLLD